MSERVADELHERERERAQTHQNKQHKKNKAEECTDEDRMIVQQPNVMHTVA